MTSLPSGDVRQYDVMRWAQEQAVFLSPPSAHHVLLYLCLNAFYSDENPERKHAGDVLSAFTPIARIRRHTGLGERTVRRALEVLEEEGYLYVATSPGRGYTAISVFWSEAADERRAEFRAGLRDLPKGMRRKDRKPAKPSTTDRNEQVDNVISVEFGVRSE